MKLPCPDPEGCKHFQDANKFQCEIDAYKKCSKNHKEKCPDVRCWVQVLRDEQMDEIERLKNCIECAIEDLKAWHCLSDDIQKRNIERFVKDLGQFKEN